MGHLKLHQNHSTRSVIIVTKAEILITNITFQVYIIFAQMASRRVLPAVFALLPSKDKATYLKMWTVIKESLDGYIPTTLIIDMEIAAGSAFIAIFGETIILIYCYFHWRKALRENIQKKGCLVEVSTNPDFNKLYRMICSLAFVPAEDIAEVIDQIVTPFVDELEENISPAALDWCDYFVTTYVGSFNERTKRRRQPKLPPIYWSQYRTVLDNKPYTNNSVEGFNNAWNQSSTVNASVWASIEHFQREESLAMARWREDITLVEQVLQCNALYCSVLQGTALYCTVVTALYCTVLTQAPLNRRITAI
jgi:hypothetical protein